MNYETFIHVVTNEMEGLLGDRYSVRLDHQMKNNGIKKDVLLILSEDQKVSPVIELEPFFQEYQKNTSMVDILEEIHEIYRYGSRMNVNVHSLEDWESVRESIGARLVSADANEERLRGCPHRRYLDMALIYDIHVDGEDMVNGSAVVSLEHMRCWNVKEEDLFRQCQMNLPRLHPPCIYGMEDLMRELLFQEPGTNLMHSETNKEDEIGSDPDSLYVITNTDKYYGATSVIYEGLMNQFMERHGWKKVYLIPSSVHEMILFPVKPEAKEKEFIQLIHDVNEEYVTAADILTDSLYTYDREQHILQKAVSAGGDPKYHFGVTIL